MVNMIELSKGMKKELAFSEEEKKGLEKARMMPVTFDADCPETTPERASGLTSKPVPETA